MAQTATMDFFQHQDDARRKTSLLIAYYGLAVLLIILGVYLAFAATLLGVQAKTGAEMSPARLWHPEIFLWVSGSTIAVVALGTLFKIQQLKTGGRAVAHMMGARPVEPATADPDERRLLNVVEEMAIASGVPVPAVFVLEAERGINAFAAGFSTADAVVAVTRGCMRELSRDELQGVIAHEFSHILNGDMRLNIRLMGVLHGILVIALIGYWIMRTTMHSSSHARSGKKGNAAPIALLGLAVMAVGYIGIFFGKLIKSAVSRQREFLADASAVQFTRNADGISGALKHIGRYAGGSHVGNRHAEEASHFFFADGLKHSLIGLMATHPPLAERIRRIDPSFDGSFDRTPAGLQETEQPAGLAGIGAPVPPSVATAPGGRFAVQPDAVVSSVGAPTPEHLDYAASLIAALPAPLVDATRRPGGACAAAYSLLLSTHAVVRRTQLEHLALHAGELVYGETLKLCVLTAGLPPGARLPLMDLSMAGLKRLSRKDYHTFTACVKELVQADRQIDLFEYTLQRGIQRHLDPVFGQTRPPRVRHTTLNPLMASCVHLLSCLAGWGADSPAEAENAYRAGMRALATQDTPDMVPPDECGLEMLDDALTVLNAASAPLKKRILTACVTCIGADGFITVEEAELIRAIADTLECPIPPLLAGQNI
jgi:Zn-dependent protease with chaperone function